MVTRILLDTNLLIAMTNDESWKAILLSTSHIYTVSAVSVMELYALSGMSVSEERKIDLAINFLEVEVVTQSIAKRAGLLARTRRRRDKADLLIAATALELNVPLITKNLKDFRRIPGLDARSTL